MAKRKAEDEAIVNPKIRKTQHRPFTLPDTYRFYSLSQATWLPKRKAETEANPNPQKKLKPTPTQKNPPLQLVRPTMTTIIIYSAHGNLSITNQHHRYMVQSIESAARCAVRMEANGSISHLDDPGDSFWYEYALGSQADFAPLPVNHGPSLKVGESFDDLYSHCVIEYRHELSATNATRNRSVFASSTLQSSPSSKSLLRPKPLAKVHFHDQAHSSTKFSLPNTGTKRKACATSIITTTTSFPSGFDVKAFVYQVMVFVKSCVLMREPSRTRGIRTLAHITPAVVRYRENRNPVGRRGCPY